MNQKLLFYAAAFGVALVLIGLTRLSTGTGGLLAAAGAYDQYGYNRISREFKGSGESWCRANKHDKGCFGIYGKGTYFITWNREWDRGVHDAWVLTPYNAEIKIETDGTSYLVRWVGICVDGERLPSGGECLWGEYAVSADTGAEPYFGPLGPWLKYAQPEKF